MSETTINTDELDFDLDEIMEDLFEDFVGEYELDPEGTINDMLYEFFSEGFLRGMEAMSDDDEEEGSEEA